MPIDLETDDIYARASFNFISALNEAMTRAPGDNARLRDCVLDTTTVEWAPSSMASSDDDANTNKKSVVRLDDHLRYIDLLKTIIKTADITPFDVVTGPGPRAVVQAKANGVSYSGHPYRNDYVYFLEFVDATPASSEDVTAHESQGGVAHRCGLPKVRRWKEYVDSAFMKEFLATEEMRRTGGSV